MAHLDEIKTLGVLGAGQMGGGIAQVGAAAGFDVVLVDAVMPGVGGLNAAHRLAREAPSSKVVVLSQHDDEEYVIEAMVEAGAAGYLVKTDAAAELLSALRAVAAGRRYLSAAVTPAVLARLKNTRGAANDGSAAPAVKLTRRERAIMDILHRRGRRNVDRVL